MGLHLAARFSALVRRRPSTTTYTRLNATSTHLPLQTFNETFEPKVAQKPARKLPFSRIWSKNVIFTLITVAFFDFHLG